MSCFLLILYTQSTFFSILEIFSTYFINVQNYRETGKESELYSRVSCLSLFVHQNVIYRVCCLVDFRDNVCLEESHYSFACTSIYMSKFKLIYCVGRYITKLKNLFATHKFPQNLKFYAVNAAFKRYLRRLI